MSDAYLEWLEIPPHLRPPTHYQLLGIEPSELDRDAIAAAAQRQLDKLQPHKEGPDADECAPLAAQIVKARDTLLDPVERQRYDTLAPDSAEPWWKEPETKPEPPPSSPPIPGEEWWKEGAPGPVAEEPAPTTITAPYPAVPALTAPPETATWWVPPAGAETGPDPAAVATFQSEPVEKDWWRGSAPDPEAPPLERVPVLEPVPPQPAEPPVVVGPPVVVEPRVVIAPPIVVEPAVQRAPVVILADHHLPQSAGGFPFAWVIAGVILLAAGGVGAAIMVKNGVFDSTPKQVAQVKPKEDPTPSKEKNEETQPKPKPQKKNNESEPKVVLLDPDLKKQSPKKVLPEPKKEPVSPEPEISLATAATYGGHPEGSVYGIALARNARFFVDVSDDRTIGMYGTGKGNHSVVHKLRSPGVAVALCNDDRTAVFCDGGQVVVHDLEGRRQRAVFDNPRGGIRCLAAAPNGSFVLTGGTDSCVRWWTVADSKLAQTFDLDEKAQITAAAISSDGQSAAFGLSDGRVASWDLAKRRELKRWKVSNGPVRSLAFALDGQRLVSGGEDGQVSVWQPSSGKLLTKLAGHKGAVLGAGWCADGQRILTAGIDKQVCMWDPQKAGAAIWSTEAKEKIFSLAVDLKGRFVLAGLAGGSIQRLPLPQGPGSQSEPMPGTSEP